jgi:hypothetical protein
VVYNLKYDSGAILQALSEFTLIQLWEAGEAFEDGYHYTYIPHKLLRIRKGNIRVSMWDISQFFHMSLDKASRTYLNKGKIDIRTKRFTRKYVERFWRSIAKYCIQDATLTKELADFLLKKLKSFEIFPTALYSCASLSFKYYSDNAKIVTSWRYWKHHRKLLKMACDSYEGGKFEVTARGRFTGYEYDLVSAYPAEIINLVDISRAEVEYTPKYQNDAIYGFLRCRINNLKMCHLPCGIKRRKDKVRTYPAGDYYLTITKEEYDYIVTLDVEIEIIDAAWLFVRTKRYPYRKTSLKLFKIKTDSKNKDLATYANSKTILNSFYGKTVQCIEQKDNTVVAGAGWNPIYGSIITANTRIKMTEMQNLLKEDCMAVHTDSVITKKPIPKSLITGKLGEFELVEKGEGIIIACGMYQIADACAFKGFIPNKGDSWFSILNQNRNRKKIPYKTLRVESWIEAMSKGHGKKTVNVFETFKKNIDLNGDTKRAWSKSAKGKDLLNSLELSFPLVHYETQPPKHWDDNEE